MRFEKTFCRHKISTTWNVSEMIQLRLHLCFRVVLELKLGFWGFGFFAKASFVVFGVLHFPISCKTGWMLDTYRPGLKMLLDLM